MTFNTFGGGGGTPTVPENPDILPDVGSTASGGTLVTSGVGNVLGSYVSIFTATEDLIGFHLYVGLWQSASSRGTVVLSIDGGATIWHPEFQLPAGVQNGYHRVYIPLKVPAGTVIHAAHRNANATQTCRMYIEGESAANAADTIPGYDTATALNAFGTANTRPSSTQVTSANDTTTYTDVVTLAAEYKAFLVTLGSSTNPSSTAAPYICRLAKHNGGAKTVLRAQGGGMGGGGQWGALLMRAHAVVAAGQTLAVNLETTNTDNPYCGIIGYS